jgi:hypothetical protein
VDRGSRGGGEEIETVMKLGNVGVVLVLLLSLLLVFELLLSLTLVLVLPSSIGVKITR